MLHPEQARILGCTRKELRVLQSLQTGKHTPSQIAKASRVSRPAVYDILLSLRERGLVVSQIDQGKKTWHIESVAALEDGLYQAKKGLLQIPDGSERVHGRDESLIVVHRGKEAIRKVIFEMLLGHSGERLYGFQGDTAVIGWNQIFSVAETNRFNRAIKKHGLLVEAVLPKGWFERQVEQFGVEWAKDFEGRATRVHTIDPQYFLHGGQIWMFKDSLYLLALHEELVIEIQNSEMQKMVRAFFQFMQDNSRTIDANALLRTLVHQGE